MLVRQSSGSDSTSRGRTKIGREPEDGLDEACQDAGVCIETRTVSQIDNALFATLVSSHPDLLSHLDALSGQLKLLPKPLYQVENPLLVFQLRWQS